MLILTDHLCKQLAMSRNHQMEGDNKVAYMSVAYTEVELDEKQIDGLMGSCTWRSWFNVNGADIQPMPWTKKMDLCCRDAFKEVAVDMVVGGKKELEFSGCRLYFDDFKLLSGGKIMVDMHLHVMKAKDSEWTAIGHAEYTEIRLSLGDGVLIERKARRQRELPLEPDAESPESKGATYAAAAAARTQDDGDVLVWYQTAAGAKDQCKRKDLPVGCVEIDPPEGSASEKQQEAAEAGSDDTDAFAEGAARAVGAHMKRGRRGVVDGRSERVKHQDRQRGEDSAH